MHPAAAPHPPDGVALSTGAATAGRSSISEEIAVTCATSSPLRSAVGGEIYHLAPGTERGQVRVSPAGVMHACPTLPRLRVGLPPLRRVGAKRQMPPGRRPRRSSLVTSVTSALTWA
jgi:hypothetical protein